MKKECKESSDSEKDREALSLEGPVNTYKMHQCAWLLAFHLAMCHYIAAHSEKSSQPFWLEHEFPSFKIVMPSALGANLKT